MATVLHKADTRGHADHGWLNAYHSFSFASWYNPERVQFGALRVLNDDTVAAGMGFAHIHTTTWSSPFHLKEIWRTKTAWEIEIIRNGDVQVMSAGTGVKHSEFNQTKTNELNCCKFGFSNQKM
jgi:redox-sensitive bicupin YhaK (pirin superfamily)